MTMYDINEVIEYADDLKRAVREKDEESLNQAIMRLSDASSNLHVIDSFDEIDES